MFREPYSFRGHRVVMVNIDRPTAAQSGTGAPSTGWTAFLANVPMAIENVSSLERYADQAVQGIQRFELLSRYVAGITERMRAVFTNDGTTYTLDIEGTDNPNMRNRWLILRCKSGVNRG